MQAWEWRVETGAKLVTKHIITFTVDLRISGFVMVLHLPFLLKLQQFASNLPQAPEPSQPPPPTTTVAKKNSVAKTKVYPMFIDKSSFFRCNCFHTLSYSLFHAVY